MRKSVLLLMTTLMFAACSQRENPLLVESDAPFGAPEFSKIKSSDYLPLLRKGSNSKKPSSMRLPIIPKLLPSPIQLMLWSHLANCWIECQVSSIT